MNDGQSQPLKGVAVAVQIAAAAYFLLACQDATLKYLLTGFSIWQLLSIRSAMILAACLAAGGRGVVSRAIRSPNRWVLAGRAFTSLAAWWCFFTAARVLPIGPATTLYLVAPILATGFAACALGERIGLRTGLALACGALGTLISFDTAAPAATGASALVFAGAVLWAASLVLMRWVGQRESALVQLASTNVLFCGVCGAAAVSTWHTPGAGEAVMIAATALLGGAGQWLLTAAARHAPVALIAPLQYSGLLWAFVLGFVVWGDVPSDRVLAGAVTIALGGVAILLPLRSAGMAGLPIRAR